MRITFLADTGAVLLDRLGILHRDAPNDWGDIAFPTSVLVDEEGVVRWIYASDTYRQRARPEDVFEAIRALDL